MILYFFLILTFIIVVQEQKQDREHIAIRTLPLGFEQTANIYIYETFIEWFRVVKFRTSNSIGEYFAFISCLLKGKVLIAMCSCSCSCSWLRMIIFSVVKIYKKKSRVDNLGFKNRLILNTQIQTHKLCIRLITTLLD